jgi:hypothetical protein
MMAAEKIEISLRTLDEIIRQRKNQHPGISEGRSFSVPPSFGRPRPVCDYM